MAGRTACPQLAGCDVWNGIYKNDFVFEHESFAYIAGYEAFNLLDQNYQKPVPKFLTIRISHMYNTVLAMLYQYMCHLAWQLQHVSRLRHMYRLGLQVDCKYHTL